MNHTPGPWELDTAKDRDGRYHIVNGQLPKGINAEFGYPVCDSSNRHHCITPQEDAANARLIAAAPEMLRVLQEISEWADNRADIDWNDQPNNAMQVQSLLGQIIAKATGGAK